MRWDLPPETTASAQARADAAKDWLDADVFEALLSPWPGNSASRLIVREKVPQKRGESANPQACPIREAWDVFPTDRPQSSGLLDSCPVCSP